MYLENIYLDIALRLIASLRLIALALYACEISLTRCHILNDLKKTCSCIWAEPKMTPYNCITTSNEI